MLIFDMDGVLVNSEAIISAVLADHLGQLGVQITAAQSELTRGLRLHDRLQLVQANHNLDLPDDFIGTLQAATRARLRTDLQPIPHIESALASISHPRCLVSSSAPDQIGLSLSVTGLDALFPEEHRFSASQVEWGKPDPALFRFAADQVGVHAKDCMVIANSIAGVRAGKQARMPVLAFAPGGQGRDAMASAGALVFSDMRSLAAMVQAVWAVALNSWARQVTCFKA